MTEEIPRIAIRLGSQEELEKFKQEGGDIVFYGSAVSFMRLKRRGITAKKLHPIWIQDVLYYVTYYIRDDTGFLPDTEIDTGVDLSTDEKRATAVLISDIVKNTQTYMEQRTIELLHDLATGRPVRFHPGFWSQAQHSTTDFASDNPYFFTLWHNNETGEEVP